MGSNSTILEKLEAYIKREGLKFSQLKNMVGLNPGTLSSILNGNRIMTVYQLDDITSLLSLPEGELYGQYIQESLAGSAPNWRRIKPFIDRCAELRKLDCIQTVLPLLMEDLTYSGHLFELAENFFHENKREAASFIYESIAASEKYQHSERLAVCQYRLFSINLGDDQIKNLEIALQFEPFVDRLDEMDQLDALKDLANVYRSLRYWVKLDEMAQALEQKAAVRRSLMQQSKENQYKLKLNRPFFVYVVYPKLLRAIVCDAEEDYAGALRLTYEYADLDWVEEQDPETQYWKELFLKWAKQNICVNKLLSGDTHVLPDYVQCIEAEEEILSELLNIVEAANRFQIDVDPILHKFKLKIDLYERVESGDLYTRYVQTEQSTRFWHELAKYYLHKGDHVPGFKYLLRGLKISHTINSKTAIINNVGLFESFRECARPEMLAEYQNLIERVWKKNDKKNNPAIINR